MKKKKKSIEKTEEKDKKKKKVKKQGKKKKEKEIVISESEHSVEKPNLKSEVSELSDKDELVKMQTLDFNDSEEEEEESELLTGKTEESDKN